MSILADGIKTVGVEEKVELARWSSGNALLVGAVLGLAALYLVYWMYRRESRGRVTRRLRVTLVVCRATVLILLGLIGLEPVLVKYVHRRLGAYTLVLVDDSASMSLADRYRSEDRARRVAAVAGEPGGHGVGRSEICEAILRRDGERWLEQLAAKNAVKIFSFADQARFWRLVPQHTAGVDLAKAAKAADGAGDIGQAFRADGAATDVGQAIRAAMDSVGGSPVAGVVLLTDGRFNRGESAGLLGRLLWQKHVPLYAIGVGDPAEPVNVRVVQLSAPRTVFNNDPFSVTASLEAQGVAGASIEVELFERRRGGEDSVARSAEASRPVETRTVRPDAQGRIAPVVFERKVAEPGEVSYAVRVVPLAFEAVTSDNEREALPAVRVLDDKMRVLLIAGSPSYDYRFCVRMLERDATVNVSAWLQSADINAVRDGNTVITELPATTEALNKYDAILLMDCDPKEFGPTWASLVATFVSDYGGGLLYEAGNKYTGRFFRSTKLQSLVEVLPVVPDPEAEIVINELGHYQTRAWPILIPEAAASDPILRQSDDPGQTQAIWADLGRIYWHYPVRRAKPVARVLMQHSNPRMANTFGPHVILANQFVGTGRTAYLGINATWRWRRSDERHFNRFWIEMLRYLVEGKLLGGRERGQILCPKDQYEVGQTVVLTVRALDERFNPLLMPELRLSVKPVAGTASAGAEGETVSLRPISGREGYYQGRFVAGSVGTLRLTLDLPPEGAPEAGQVSQEIVVSQPDIEMRDTAMNRAGLKAFVEAAGGRSRYLDVDEADSVADMVEDRSRTVVVRGRPRPLWDNRYVFAVLVGLLTVEWIGRKRARLL